MDAIDRFLKLHVLNGGVLSKIRLTGGETLLNEESVGMVNYITSKWPEAKITLMTNGVNLLKFYDKLPKERLDSVHISLDGTKEIHLARRYSGITVDEGIYDGIIQGIKRLLSDETEVIIKTIYDKGSFRNYPEFMKFLSDEGISNFPHFKQVFSSVFDYGNPIDIDEAFNDKNDLVLMKDFFESHGLRHFSTYSSLNILSRIINRPPNEPFMPRHQRCDTRPFLNPFFSANGTIYFCEQIHESKGNIGTYYPNILIDQDTIKRLENRSIMSNTECAKCSYKFVCLGNCPLCVIAKDSEMSCGVFSDPEILDNLEFPI